MAVNIDTATVSVNVTANELGAPHLDDRTEGNGPAVAYLPQSDHILRRKNETQTQHAEAGTSSLAPPLTDRASRSVIEDTPMDDTENSTSPSPGKVHRRKFVKT
jgi:hypothetical protein